MKVGDLVKFRNWIPRKTGTPWFIDTSLMDRGYEGYVGIIIEELPYNTDLFKEYGIPEDILGRWYIVLWSDGSQEPLTAEDLELVTENT